MNIIENEKKPMRTGKANGWGTFHYHWVEIPVTEDMTPEIDIEQAKTWCLERLGKESTRWFYKNGKFYFNSEQDMTIFILRWS